MDTFGRRYSQDIRDRNYPLAAIVPATAPGITYRYWNDNQWWGNQGPYPHCVAYAWTHWAEDGPVTHKDVPPPLVDPVAVYNRAQQIDEWPGTNYDGTSVRAGAKVLQEHGIISSYHWAWRVDEIVQTILTTGPVVVGTDWYHGMSRPDQNYIMSLSGAVLGGHAYMLSGVNTNKRLFRVKNSWGRNWGKNGRAWISFADMGILIGAHGEACLAVEVN
jgi:hypothetical protein